MPQRSDFINNVTDWRDIIEFCVNNDLDIPTTLYDNDELNDYIEENLEELARNYYWTEVLEVLQNIPQGFDFYIKEEDSLMEFSPARQSDFNLIKNEILEHMDDINGWDEGEQEPDTSEESNQESENQEEFNINTDISIDDFLISNVNDFQKIMQDKQKEEDEIIDELSQIVVEINDVAS